LTAQADAHPPSALTAGRTFDGTYQFVSSAKVNPMFTSSKGDMAPFPDRTRYELQGPVGPNGQLDMRLMNVGGGGSRPLEIRTTAAQIDRTGKVRARQIGGACSYDYVWAKRPK
jgi:hypothetical protein